MKSKTDTDMDSGMKIVRLMGPAARSARIFHEWLESNDVISVSNDREMRETSAGFKPLRNCAVFPAAIAERVAADFNAWIDAQGDFVTVTNRVRSPREWKLGLPPSREKKIKMFVGAGHGIRAFTQNWK